MDSRKTRIIGALALATAAAVIIQEGRGISPGLSHFLTAGAFPHRWRVRPPSRYG